MMIQARQTTGGETGRVSSSSTSFSTSTISTTTSTAPTATQTVMESCSMECDLKFTTRDQCTANDFIQKASKCYYCDPKASVLEKIATDCSWDSKDFAAKFSKQTFRPIGDIPTLTYMPVPTGQPPVHVQTENSPNLKWLAGILVAFVPALVFLAFWLVFKRRQKNKFSKAEKDLERNEKFKRRINVRSMAADSLYIVPCPEERPESVRPESMQSVCCAGNRPPSDLGPHPSESIEAARARKSWRWSWRASTRASLDFTVKNNVMIETPTAVPKAKVKDSNRGSVLSICTEVRGEDMGQYDLAIEVVNERGSPNEHYRTSVPILRLDIPVNDRIVGSPRPASPAPRRNMELY